MIQFWVEGNPRAQPRPRRAKNGHFYNPDNGVVAWKDAVGWQAKAARVKRLAGPVKLTLSFVLPGGKTRVSGQPHASKPDFDNLEKACCDALTGYAWVDDSQIFDCHTIKRYGEKPGVLITIEEVTT